MASPTFLIICASVASISGWTIDLPETRKEAIEKHKNQDHPRLNNFNQNEFISGPNEDRKRVVDFERFFDDEDSREEDDPEEDQYQEFNENYRKQSYMEKKVHHIVRNGNKYLEGLKMALEGYMEDVKSCRQAEARAGANSDRKNDGTLDALLPEARRNFDICQYVTEHSERIRRLSQLAIQTIRELQEKDLKEGYYDTLLSPEDNGMEERELILKLAWFLDQIAHLTGFDPNPEQHIRRETTTQPPSSLSVRPSTQPEIMSAMTECLNMNSSIPAAVRCAYPQQYLNEWREMYRNLTASVEQSKLQDRSQSVTFENRDDDRLTVKRQKRSIENDPVMNVLHYYAKHKAWTLDNPEKLDNKIKNDNIFIDSNALPPKHLSKRSISEDINVYLNPSSEDTERINRALKDLHNGERSLDSVKNDLEITRTSRQKRSVGFKSKKVLPVSKQNPQYLSYYGKSKTPFMKSNLKKAGIVRHHFDAVKNNQNIEVIRRYAGNPNAKTRES